MWVVEKYVWWFISFVALWAILFVSTHYGCNSVGSNQMQPFVTNESFIIIHSAAVFPEQVEAQKDIVQFEYTVKGRPNSKFVARVIGKPGDRIRMTKGKVFRAEKGGGKEEQLAEQYVSPDLLSPDTEELEDVLVPRGCYWVMGDNRKREAERDSRKFGPISVYAVDGTVGKMPFAK